MKKRKNSNVVLQKFRKKSGHKESKNLKQLNDSINNHSKMININNDHPDEIYLSKKSSNLVAYPKEEKENYKEYVNNNFNDLNKSKVTLQNSKTLNITSLNTTSNTKKSKNTFNFSQLKILELKPNGLYNPSVYCFMNTTMQCLASIPELNYYFKNEEYKKEGKGKFEACSALMDFCDYYYDTKSSFKPPKSLYKICNQLLLADEQHDCQEFLRKFLEKIQDEINGKAKYSLDGCKSLNEAWNLYIDKNFSIVDQIFAGMFRGSVVCNKCKFPSGKFLK